MGKEVYISVDIEQSHRDATQIAKAADILQAKNMAHYDGSTTLRANANLHSAFAQSQSILAALGSAMDKEASNVRSIGAAFEQYDSMLADFAK